MNSNFRQKFLTVTMILLATIFFIPAFAGAFTPDKNMHGRGFGMKRHHMSPLGIWQNPKMIEELGLSEKQVQELREADFIHREKCLQLKSKLNGLRLEMEKLFSVESVNKTEVLQLAQKISDQKGKLFVRKIESRLAVRKLLTAEQLEKLKAFDFKRHTKRGKMVGHKQHRRIPRGMAGAN